MVGRRENVASYFTKYLIRFWCIYKVVSMKRKFVKGKSNSRKIQRHMKAAWSDPSHPKHQQARELERLLLEARPELKLVIRKCNLESYFDLSPHHSYSIDKTTGKVKARRTGFGWFWTR